MTDEQRWFIQGNRAVMSVEDLAKHTGLKPEAVQSYLDETKRTPKAVSHVELMLHKETKGGNKKAGVVAMTQGASEIADEAGKRAPQVTQEMINKAAAHDPQYAAELARLREQGVQDAEQFRKIAWQDRIFFIGD